MTTDAIKGSGEVNYINASKGLMSWLTTTDHKRIGIMYLIGMCIFFFVTVNIYFVEEDVLKSCLYICNIFY